MTYKMAKKLLSVGDVVYFIDDGVVCETEVVQIFDDCLSVHGGYLYYDDVGEEWFLTKLCAEEKAKH